MSKTKRRVFFFAVFLSMQFMFGCASVNVRTDMQSENRGEPDFQKRYSYWWWGLKGEHSINVREICLAREVEQMQAIDTVSDVALQLVTLGIYLPRTARVWCEEVTI